MTDTVECLHVFLRQHGPERKAHAPTQGVGRWEEDTPSLVSVKDVFLIPFTCDWFSTSIWQIMP